MVGMLPRVLVTTALLLLVVMTGCSERPASADKTASAFIGVADDNWNFVDNATGEIFVPFGVNYCFWQSLNREQIEKDIARMKRLGVNTIRVNIPPFTSWLKRTRAYQFEPDLGQLADFFFLVETAGDADIRLDVCQWLWGYPKEAGDIYASDEAIAYQQAGYRVLAAELKDERAVFAWTLMNEPRNSWQSPAMEKKWNAWLEEKYGNIDLLAQAWQSGNGDLVFSSIPVPPNEHDAGSQRLYDYQLFKRSIAYAWTEAMVSAIRSQDQNHLISLGAVQWSMPFDRLNEPGGFNGYTGFDPKVLAPLLDFTCVHYYPFSWHHPNALTWETIEDEEVVNEWLYSAEAFFRYSYVGKPVLFEEFNFGLTPRGEEVFDPNVWEMVADWNEKEIHFASGLASGFLSWPYRDRPEHDDITNAGGLVDPNDNLKPWGRTFRKLAAEFRGRKLQRIADDVTMTVDEKQILTSGEALKEFWKEYLALRKMGKRVNIKVIPPKK